MIKKQKFLGIVSAVMMASLLGACSGAESEGVSKANVGVEASAQNGAETGSKETAESAGASDSAQNVSLKERGQAVLKVMLEKVHNEDFSKLIGMTNSMQESEYYQKLKNAGYDKLKHVYKVDFADELYNLYTTTYAKAGVLWDNMSEGLQDSLRDQILDSYANLVNNRLVKVEAVAMSSMFSTEDFFVDASFSHKREMLIYVYEDGYPIVVTFSGKTDGAVSARASVLFVDDFDYDKVEDVKDALVNMLFNGVEEVLGALNVRVEDITK